MTDVNTLSDDADLTMLDPSLADLVRSSRTGRPHCKDTLVLWVFRDVHDRWWVREEAGGMESFADRDSALDFARSTGRVWGSYRIFIELTDGRVMQEMLNLGR